MARLRVHRATLLLLLLMTATAGATQPNIVLIMSDDMGYSDIQPYGGEIHTPNLQQMANDGLRFSQFYATPRCSASRASLLTGQVNHNVGMGLNADGSVGLPGYLGELRTDNNRTIPELMATAGYRSYMVGKWHLTNEKSANEPLSQQFNWPLQRGFDEFYGMITGAGSFYDPATLARGNTMISPFSASERAIYDREHYDVTDYAAAKSAVSADPAATPSADKYFFSNAISDNAVMQIEDHFQNPSTMEEPLFQFVSYTAAHWPIHSLPEDKAKYDGAYDAGYQAVRQARFQRLKDEGLIPQNTVLPPPPQNWNSLSSASRAWETDAMEAYAGLVDNMDQGIGKIREALELAGELDNTLFIYLQDNGGNAENYGRGGNVNNPPPTQLHPSGPINDDTIQTSVFPNRTRDGYAVRGLNGLGGQGVEVGGPDTYISYGRNWANVSNTPLQFYKTDTAEGGIASPLIMSWGNGLDSTLAGQINHTPTTIHDIMPTLLELAGVEYPGQSAGLDPLEGVSLASSFQGGPIDREKPLFFEHLGWKGVRDGKWKAVAPSGGAAWELYDLDNDRSETYNLASQNPDQVSQMALDWQGWAVRNNVVPWPFNPEFRGEMLVHLTMDDPRAMHGLGVRDSSGHIFHGIMSTDDGLASHSVPNAGLLGLGGAISFDGDIIDLEYTDELPYGADPRTFALWVKTDSFASRQDVFGYGDLDIEGRQFTISLASNGDQPIVTLRAGGRTLVQFTPDPSAEMQEGEWLHLAASVPQGATDLDDVVVYVNGRLAGSERIGPNAALDTAVTNLGVGMTGAGILGGALPQFGLDGLVGDFQLYQLGLSAEQAEFLYLNPGLDLTQRSFAAEASLPGDYNQDGVVDAADYTVWRDQLNQVGPGLFADGDRNGVVDQADYELWRMHYGANLGVSDQSPSSSAPEPTAFLLLAGVLVATSMRRTINQ